MKSPEPDNQTNLLLAVVLSMAVMFAWQIFFAAPQFKEEQARQQRERAAAQQQAPTPSTQAPRPGAIPRTQPSAGTLAPSSPAADRATALAASPRVPIKTPSLLGSISLQGGRIDDLVLEKHHERVDPKSPDVVLFSPLGAPGAYFAEHGWQAASGSQLKMPDGDTIWRLESGETLTPERPVTLAWDNGEGLFFRRVISVDADYMFTIEDAVENKTPGDAVLTPYARIYRIGTPKIEGFIIQHEGLIGVPGDAGLEEITYADALKDGVKYDYGNKTGGWMGFTDKYWASALVPPQHAVYSASFSGRPAAPSQKEYFWSDYVLSPVTAPAGQTAKVESRLFAGAKQVHVINAYEEKYGIERFGWLVDWGYFYFFTKPLFYLLDWLYKLFGNFGVAILAVTVIVKAAFFPLANKSYESMAKMKKLQPEMEKLKERFKDDKARQQQELMKLYQAQKINPLAGCLPILLQIPVFFALYKVLYISIDMRHAPFFGWIQDLSAPDPTSVFNLFGLLPFAVPAHFDLGFIHIPLLIGVWPLLMGITMWLQMQLNPPQPDPTQQMIFNWMPVMFTFLLASFPAGLVIYWTWNNILSLAQQWYIMKRQGADVALGDNIRKAFAPVANLPVWKPVGEAAKSVSAKAGWPKPKTGAARPSIKPAQTPPRAPAPAAETSAGAMTTEQALSTLGLSRGASRNQIEAAYKTLMKKSRPATGKPDQLVAAKIGKARDVLLRNGRA